MPTGDQQQRATFRSTAALVAIPTGTKVFLILSFALLPLALIAVIASLRTTQTADMEARALLRVASQESTRALTNELVGDTNALKVLLAALDTDRNDAPSCARVQGIFAQQIAAGGRFAVTAADGSLLCGEAINVTPMAVVAPGEVAVDVVPTRGLILTIGGERGTLRATSFFPTGLLATIARPSGFMPAYGATLQSGNNRLALETLERRGALDRRERIESALPVPGLALVMEVRAAPITSPMLVTMLLPLLMWAAAAMIGWFVVDLLLIRPLRRLRRSVGAYVPGTVIEPSAIGAVAATEIRELGETFRDITRTVQLHEADLAEGLVRQTRLTREVHHRVKNNLQVIASLINFHARSAEGEHVADAYASIQRRVDALAVVHRHHFAEMEENRGVEIRSIIGELASNIRATVADRSSRLTITLDLAPYLVSQDVAVAMSFLLTEIIELAMTSDASATLVIMLRPAESQDESTNTPTTASTDVPVTAMLSVESAALIGSDIVDELVERRYGRVMTGLSRQLRAPLTHDRVTGCYAIPVTVRSVF